MALVRSSLCVAASVLVLAALAGAGCGERPEVRKREALARATGYVQAGKLNEALVEFQNALRVDPGDVSALHGLGRVYARKAWVYDAIRELGRARAHAPDDLSIAADYGRALLEVGAWTEAEAAAQ